MKIGYSIDVLKKRFSLAHLGLDLRSLAFFRILVGILIITDILGRFPDIAFLHTPDGIIPFQKAIKHQFPFYSVINIHQFFDSLWGIRFLFSLHILFAISLMLGFKTRTASILCWFFQVSLHSQNPLIQNSGDVFLRDALFWLPFLPLSEFWALDKKKSIPNSFARIQSWATWGVILQIFWMYFATALQKNHSSWWPNGTAGETALYVEAFTLPLGVLARELPSWLLRVGTLGVFLWELLGGFLLVLPFFQPRLRLVGLIGFLFLHVFLVLTVSLGHFQWNVLACLMVMLPSSFWNFLSSKRHFHFNPLGTQEYLKSFSLTKSQNLVLVFLISLMTFRNLTSIPQLREWKKYTAISHLLKCTNFLRFDHDWNLFAPQPIRNNGWYEIEVILQNGDKINLPPHPYTQAVVNGSKPQSMLEHYGSQRWKDYYFYIFRDAYDNTWPYLKDFHCLMAKKKGYNPKSLKVIYHYQMLEFSNKKKSLESKPLSKTLIEKRCN